MPILMITRRARLTGTRSDYPPPEKGVKREPRPKPLGRVS